MEDRRPLKPVRTRQHHLSSPEEFSFSPAATTKPRKVAGANGGAVQQDVARRLAQVIQSHNYADHDEPLFDDDGLGFEIGLPPPLLLPDRDRATRNNGVSRRTRSPSPLVARNFVQHTPSVFSESDEWSEATAKPAIVEPEENMPGRTPTANTPTVFPTPKPNRRFPYIDHLHLKDPGTDSDEYSLRDELDILNEENENLIEKLRAAERKCEEAEARARFLEGQVATLGEGALSENKLMRRKQEELRRREEALKAARQNRIGKEEIADLRSEMKKLKIEAAETASKLQETEAEAKSLRIMTERMILTHEEMEEVVLKRCWLSRYWGLAVQYGICADIAGRKYEFWSAFAPLPFEVVISAGQKAKEDVLNNGEINSNGLSKASQHPGDHNGEGNIENMLSVEMGLKEMASLKVEDAIVLSMVQRRRPYVVRDFNAVGDPNFMDSFELGQEESNDVRFKQAWLTYFWKRARDHLVELDIAEERFQLWSSRFGESPTLQDAVDVERGLIELRKLGIQQQLWEACRKEIVYPSTIQEDNENHVVESDYSS